MHSGTYVASAAARERLKNDHELNIFEVKHKGSGFKNLLI